MQTTVRRRCQALAHRGIKFCSISISPEIVHGAAIRPVRGTFTITGWALSKDGIAEIRCELDGLDLGTCRRTRREDVARSFPDHGWESALLSGFEFLLAGRALTGGRHQVTIKISSGAGRNAISTFAIHVAGLGEQRDPWRLRERVSPSEQIFTRGLIDQFAAQPRFYIRIDCRKENAKALAATLQSLASQIYGFWEAVVTGDVETSVLVDRAVRDQIPHLSARIRCFTDETDAAELISQARPNDLVLALDAGDLLSADAFFEFAASVNCEEFARLIYADERRWNMATGRVEPFFKPDWSPTLLLATNYVGRPWCTTVELFQSTCRPLFHRGPLENFDLVLDCTERARRVWHVQKVLAQRGEHNVETNEAEARALQSAFKRRRLDWQVSSGLVQNTYRCRPKATMDGLVSIIIATCAAGGLIQTCIESIRAISTYKPFEIIVIDNIADEKQQIETMAARQRRSRRRCYAPFNWSQFNNVGGREASGSYLLFLNGTTSR